MKLRESNMRTASCQIYEELLKQRVSQSEITKSQINIEFKRKRICLGKGQLKMAQRVGLS